MGEASRLQSTGWQRVGCAERLSRGKWELGWVSSHLTVQSVTQGCWRFARLMELGHGLPGPTREAQAEPTRSQRKERRCRAAWRRRVVREPGGSARGSIFKLPATSASSGRASLTPHQIRPFTFLSILLLWLELRMLPRARFSG